MGQQRRKADRKVQLGIWRVRLGVCFKIVGALLCLVGVTCLCPSSLGDPERGLSQFHFLAGSVPLLPIGGWFLLLGAAAFILGTSITREWDVF
jgi:hypothetical protein